MSDSDKNELRDKRRRQLYLQMRLEELKAETQALREERIALTKEISDAKAPED